jgi:hypothetical protein
LSTLDFLRSFYTTPFSAGIHSVGKNCLYNSPSLNAPSLATFMLAIIPSHKNRNYEHFHTNNTGFAKSYVDNFPHWQNLAMCSKECQFSTIERPLLSASG